MNLIIRPYRSGEEQYVAGSVMPIPFSAAAVVETETTKILPKHASFANCTSNNTQKIPPSAGFLSFFKCFLVIS